MRVINLEEIPFVFIDGIEKITSFGLAMVLNLSHQATIELFRSKIDKGCIELRSYLDENKGKIMFYRIDKNTTESLITKP